MEHRFFFADDAHKPHTVTESKTGRLSLAALILVLIKFMARTFLLCTIFSIRGQFKIKLVQICVTCSFSIIVSAHYLWTGFNHSRRIDDENWKFLSLDTIINVLVGKQVCFFLDLFVFFNTLWCVNHQLLTQEFVAYQTICFHMSFDSPKSIYRIIICHIYKSFTKAQHSSYAHKLAKNIYFSWHIWRRIRWISC